MEQTLEQFKSKFSIVNTSLDLSNTRVEKQRAICNKSSDVEFMKWLSSLCPTYLSSYPSLPRETQCKLKSLFLISQQADCAVDEVLKSIHRSDQEYDALAEKAQQQLQMMGLGDDDICSEMQIILQEMGNIVVKGTVGDGSDAGAASTLATGFLTQVLISKQERSLMNDVKRMCQKNEKLKETIDYIEKESKKASTEIVNWQTSLENLRTELDISQANLSRLTSVLSKSRSEIHERELGVGTTISTQTILDTHNSYQDLQVQIELLEKKLDQYCGLPPSIVEAVKIVDRTKEEMTALTNTIKTKLALLYHKK